MKKIKCLLLFSGGLDSILCAEILKDYGIKVDLVCFKSCFFSCIQAKKSAKMLDMSLKEVDISKKHLNIVKSPKYGRGQNMNPCIDCHLLMLKTAKRIMKKEKYDFIATGEVLGQRPFSQSRESLKKIDKEAGMKGLILRPLSAKLFDPTIAEKKEWVDRNKLFSIQGKTRNSQIALAEIFKINEYPNPAGGCVLTDIEFSKKFRILLEKNPDCDCNDVEIIKKGRNIYLDNNLVVVARNQEECKELKKKRKKKDKILDPQNFSGPTVLIRNFKGLVKKETIKNATEILLHYTKEIPDEIIIEVSPS